MQEREQMHEHTIHLRIEHQAEPIHMSGILAANMHSTRGKEEAGGDSKDAPAPGGAADDDRTLQPIQSLDESDPPAYVEGGGKEGDILPMKVSSHKVSSEVRPATST